MSDTRADFLLTAWQIFCLVILLLFVIWAAVHLPNVQQGISDSSDDFEIINAGPRLGLDGQVRNLPSHVPGISF